MDLRGLFGVESRDHYFPKVGRLMWYVLRSVVRALWSACISRVW